MSRQRRSNLPAPTDRRVDALLTLLADNATIVISGAKIAREIGVQRQTVWRWMETLRAAGVKVKGHPRTGYHIEQAPDVLAPKLLARRLAGTPFAKRIHHFFKTDSTNAVAMRLAAQDEPQGALVIAEEQTAGRGRAGHEWHSEKAAGIYASVILRPRISPVHAPVLTLVAGVAAFDVISAEGHFEVDIRWPNDILLNGKKICGILTEMQAEPDRVHFAVVGIGVNVNHTKMPAALANIGTSLRIETGRVHSRVEILARLLRALDRYYNLFLERGAEPIIQRFAKVSSYYEGKRVRINTASETFCGVTAGLDASGILRVRRDDGEIESVISGEVAEAN